MATEFEYNKYYTRHPDPHLWQRVHTGLSYPWCAWDGPRERMNKRRFGRPPRSIYTDEGCGKAAQGIRPAQDEYVVQVPPIVFGRLVVHGHYPLWARWGPRDLQNLGVRAWMLSF